MIPDEIVLTPSAFTRRLFGKDTREISGDQKVRIQFTGTGSETVYFDGPPEGKTWRVFAQITINERDT